MIRTAVFSLMEKQIFWLGRVSSHVIICLRDGSLHLGLVKFTLNSLWLGKVLRVHRLVLTLLPLLFQMLLIRDEPIGRPEGVIQLSNTVEVEPFCKSSLQVLVDVVISNE